MLNLKKMNPALLTSIGITCLCGILFYFYKIGGKAVKVKQEVKKFIITDENSEIIDGKLKLTDIIGFFKLLNLNPQNDIPFIANSEDAKIKKILGPGCQRQGYKSLFVGSFNKEGDSIEMYRVFFAKSFDTELQEIMGNDTLITLN